MQLFMRLTAYLVTAGLIAVSLMMNFRFGQSLGRTEWDGLVYGLASVCADGFKVLLPFAIAQAWQSRRLLATSVGALLWIAFAAYSMTSSLGHSAVNRSEVSGARRQAITSYADMRQSLETKQKERAGIAASRPVETIESELKASELKPFWRWSKGCTDVGARDQRQFCEGVLRTQGELGTARRIVSHDAEIATLTEKLGDTSTTAAGSDADPQIAILRDLTGFAADHVRIGLTILVSLMVERGSSLGLFVLVGQKSARANEATAAVITQQTANTPMLISESAELTWRRERAIEQADGFASEMDVYRDYCIWIVRNDRGPALSLSEFRAFMLREAVAQSTRKGGRTFYHGMSLRAGGVPDARSGVPRVA